MSNEVIAYATVREQQAEKLANASMSMSYLVLPEALQTRLYTLVPVSKLCQRWSNYQLINQAA